MISPELRSATWLLNTDTGLIFPQVAGMRMTNLVNCTPTDEEIMAGRKLDPAPAEAAPEEPPVVAEVPLSLEEAEAAPVETEVEVAEPELPVGVVSRRGPGRPRKEA
jgi:hypothetical protein